METRKLIYVSGPYTADTREGVDRNIRFAGQFCVELWKRGYGVICPHTNTAHFNEADISYNAFIAGDLTMVERSDAVVMLPNWKDSKGAMLERAHAFAKKVPVWHSTGFHDLPPGPNNWPASPAQRAMGIEIASPALAKQPTPATPLGIRQFESGATRDTDNGKFDYEAFISPRVLERYGKFMHKNRVQRDGTLRDGDNWQRGIPIKVYQKSLTRHFIEAWRDWRSGKPLGEAFEDTLCAILFNTMGILHERLRTDQVEVKVVAHD